MKLVPMRFLSHTWHHNPKSIKISCCKDNEMIDIPYGDNILQSFGNKPITVTGTGELYGDDCLLQFEQLKRLYESSSVGVLCVPELKPMYASFDSLDMLAQNTPSLITYSFKFTQVQRTNNTKQNTCYVTVNDGTTLWDIANTYSVDMDTLVAINPGVSSTYNLDGIERIRIC